MTADTALDARIDALANAVRDAGLDALLLTSDGSIAYVTGLHPLQLERFFGVLIRVAGDGFLVVPRLDEGEAASAPPRLERLVYEPGATGLPDLIRRLDGTAAIGVEENHLVVGRARLLSDAGVDVVRAAEFVMSRRARKDDAELERLRAACELMADALGWLWGELRPGVVERAINARVEGRLHEEGAADVHPLILFGENAATPHGHAGERELRRGDVICADVSPALDGYWGDLTRCATSGPASEWARATWVVVRDAQAAAVDAARPGSTAADVDVAQRRVVEAAAELGSCLHGAGHAIGLEAHEPPFLVPGNDAALDEGMVFTIEPGLYRTGRGGIRLEDDVLVARDGPVTLCSLGLELVETA